MSFFDDAISTIGKGLAQTAAGAISDATGFDIGGTLGFLFGDNQPTGGGNLEDLSGKLNNPATTFPVTPDELIYLQQSVEQQGQMILDVGTQLTAVQATVNSILLETKDIEDALEGINKQLLFQNWQTPNTIAGGYLTTIQSGYQQYTQYVNNYSTTPSEEIQQFQKNLLDPNDGPLDAMNAISNLILDNAQNPGLLQLWSDMVCLLIYDNLMDYRDAVNQYMDYYKQLTFAQLTATNLLMEAYNYDGNTTASTQAYTNYKTAMLAQENTFIEWLMPLINAGVAANMLHTPNFANVSGTDACLQLNPNFSQVGAGVNYYAPSPILYEAEQLLQSLYCTDDADRRIVVHMSFLAVAGFPGTLNKANLTLTPLGSTPAELTVAPVSFQGLGPFSPQFPSPTPPLSPYLAYPDMNWDSTGINYYLNRYVFSASAAASTLPDGGYQLTQLNGSPGFPSVITYASSYAGGTTNAVFQAPSVLNYTLEVNAASAFDFMNFLAYNYPYNA